MSSGNWYNFLENQNDIYTSDGNYGEFQIDAKTAVIFTNFEQTLLVQNEISPENFNLLKAYPNPFNAEISLVISAKDNVPEELNIFNIEGKLVKTIYNSSSYQNNIKLKWDGKNNFGLNVPSGVYFIISNGKNFQISKKIMLLK